MPDNNSDAQINPPMEGWAVVIYRLGQIETKLDRQISDEQRWRSEYDVRLRLLETDMARLSERMTIWQWGQAAYATFIGVVAGIFGKQP